MDTEIYNQKTKKTANIEMNLQFVVSGCLTLLILFSIYLVVKLFRAKELDENIVYNKECPICLNAFTRPMRISCGHVFCGRCLLFHFRSNEEKKCICPLCRNTVKNMKCFDEKKKPFKKSKKCANLELKLQDIIHNGKGYLNM